MSAVMRRAPIALVALAAACGTSDAAEPAQTPPSTPTPTLGGVGQLPETVPDAREPLVVVTRPPVDEQGNPVEAVADQVEGHRLLMIGDSILAGTATRYGGDMCATLVPLGWQVEIDAEPGRSVEFGNEVLDSRLDPVVAAGDDWDVVAVHLGSNYRSDRAAYEAELTEILDRVAPRPTLLYTVTEYRPAWAEVNEVVRAAGERYDNVTVLDWEEIARTPGVLSGDGLHPTDAGEQVLVDLTASALGPAFGTEGECLPTSFTDDSLVGRGDIPASPNSNSSVGGGTSSTSSGGSSGGGAVVEPPTVTDAPVTQPPPAVTDPPPVATDPPPPVTNPPPVTQPPPPVTNPPPPTAPPTAAP